MRARWWAFTVSMLLVVLLSAPPPARADDLACITASEAEATLQKQTKLREALQQAALCADPACPAEVRAECSQRIVKMNAAMPTVILAAADGDGNDLVAVEVKLDGAPLVTTLDGREIAIDPGSHVLRFEAAGKPPEEKTILLREAEKDRRISVVLGGAVAPPPTPTTTEPTSSWNTRKTLALAVGGVGVVGVAVGAGFGAVALSDWSTAKNECSVASCPSATRGAAETAHNSAATAGDVSTASFVVGVAGLAGGIVLWLTAPKGRRPTAAPEPGVTSARLHLMPLTGARSGGMMLGGSFP